MTNPETKPADNYSPRYFLSSLGAAYWGFTALALVSQMLMILLVFRRNRQHFAILAAMRGLFRPNNNNAFTANGTAHVLGCCGSFRRRAFLCPRIPCGLINAQLAQNAIIQFD